MAHAYVLLPRESLLGPLLSAAVCLEKLQLQMDYNNEDLQQYESTLALSKNDGIRVK